MVEQAVWQVGHRGAQPDGQRAGVHTAVHQTRQVRQQATRHQAFSACRMEEKQSTNLETLPVLGEVNDCLCIFVWLANQYIDVRLMNRKSYIWPISSHLFTKKNIDKTTLFLKTIRFIVFIQECWSEVVNATQSKWEFKEKDTVTANVITAVHTSGESDSKHSLSNIGFAGSTVLTRLAMTSSSFRWDFWLFRRQISNRFRGVEWLRVGIWLAVWKKL